ncbi:MAG: hypothetical protein PHQ57_04630, partial [Candidatus Omnitrophica bacterium]|nr:hypothetical protein [Candidatus Omnitrophota bacterium]
LYSALERLVSFISNFVHLDFSLGGCYDSRNTEYILPLGAEILASKVSLAAGLAAKLRLAYSKRADIGLSNVDHRYLLLHNYFYLESYREARDPLDIPSLNAAQDFSFGRCGIIGRSREGGHIVASLKKGGVFKIASTDRSLTDCGWTVCDSGRVLISYHFPSSLESHLYPEGFKVKGRLKYISTAKMTTLALVALRIYMSTFGRFKLFSRLLKNFSRYILITNSRASGIEFERDVSVNKLGIIVNDTLKGLSNNQVVYLGGSLSYALGPSTGTFRNEQLSVESLCFKEDDFQGGKLHVERQISWNTELNLFKVNNLKKELSSEQEKI